MKSSILIVLGLLGVLVGLGFVFPAIAHWRESGSIAASSIMLLLLGLCLTTGGLMIGTKGIRHVRQ